MFSLKAWETLASDNFILAQKQPPGIFCKKGFLKNFANFTGKDLYWCLFLIKLQAWRPATLLKRGSNTGLFQ